jgi:hypothetical protein
LRHAFAILILWPTATSCDPDQLASISLAYNEAIVKEKSGVEN